MWDGTPVSWRKARSPWKLMDWESVQLQTSAWLSAAGMGAGAVTKSTGCWSHALENPDAEVGLNPPRDHTAWLPSPCPGTYWWVHPAGSHPLGRVTLNDGQSLSPISNGPSCSLGQAGFSRACTPWANSWAPPPTRELDETEGKSGVFHFIMLPSDPNAHCKLGTCSKLCLVSLPTGY